MPEIRKNSADSDEDRSERSSGASTPHELAKLEKVLANNNNENLEDKKHPLQNNWTLWYFKNDKSQAWEDNLKQVITFSYVEDFWALYNHIDSASNLRLGCDYSLFKEGIKPMWEDRQNERGGVWLLTIEKGGRGSMDSKMRGELLDELWREVLMCLVGEAFGELGIIVNGAVLNIRPRADKISVWLTVSDPTQRDAIMAVGLNLKERMGLTSRWQLVFANHEEVKNKKGSMIRSSMRC